MAASSIVEVIEALARSRFDDLKGTPEGHELDFKLAPYAVNTVKGKWELAKDVSAFANANGGCLVIGVGATKREDLLVEVADRIQLVRKSVVNGEQWRSVLSEFITPPVERVVLKWFPEGDVAEGILLLQVPAQPQHLKPFVLRRAVDSDGEIGNAIAVAVRNEDRVEWWKPERLQQQLAFVANLSESRMAPPPQHDHGASDDRLVDLLREIEGWTDAEPAIGLQLAPQNALDLLSKFYGPTGLMEQLRTWEGARHSGFDLATHRAPQPGDNRLLFGDDRWRGSLSADGVFEFAMPVRDDFLGWAMRREENPTTPLRINSVALVESIYDFFRLFEQRIRPFSTTRWRCRIRAWNLKSAEVELHPGHRRRGEWRQPSKANTDSFEQSFDLDGAPEHVAVECLQRLYAAWGLGADAIPFTKDGAVQIEEIKKLHS